MRQDVDLRRIRFFVEVVRQGGFSPASKVLFATQPTVSKAIKHLEEELGMQLLHRVGTRRELTDAGRIVYQRGLDLLGTGAVLAQELAELSGVRSGTLKLGFPRLATSSLFADLFVAYKRRYPAVEVHAFAHGNSELLAHLHSGSLELAAMLEPLSSDLDSIPALDDTLVALLPKAHPLAGLVPIPLAELATMPLILFEEGCPLASQVIGSLARCGTTPRVIARTSQCELMFELVAAGMGTAFVSRRLAEGRSHRSVQPLRTRPAIPFRLSFAWRRARYLSHAARAWLEMMTKPPRVAAARAHAKR